MDTITVTNMQETGITENNIPASYFEKERIKTAMAIVHDPEAPEHSRFRRPIVAHWYMGRSRSASVVYCSVHICGMDFHTHGHGSAGGYGYDKESAALGEALRSAKVELSEYIDGTGRIREALKAVAEYFYPSYDIEIIEA